MGEHPITSGELRVGGGITVGYYRQDLAQVPLDQTLYDVINDLRPTWDRRMVQGHLGRFGFSGDEVQRRADTLSGGERARVALAMLMLEPSEPAHSRRADQPSRRRVDRGARRRDRAYEGTVSAREPRSRAVARAHDALVGAPRAARHRLRRRTLPSGKSVSTERGMRRGASPKKRSCGACRRRRRQRREDGTRRAQRAEERAAHESRSSRRRSRRSNARSKGVTHELEDPALHAAERRRAREGARRRAGRLKPTWNARSKNGVRRPRRSTLLTGRARVGSAFPATASLICAACPARRVQRGLDLRDAGAARVRGARRGGESCIRRRSFAYHEPDRNGGRSCCATRSDASTPAQVEQFATAGDVESRRAVRSARRRLSLADHWRSLLRLSIVRGWTVPSLYGDRLSLGAYFDPRERRTPSSRCIHSRQTATSTTASPAATRSRAARWRPSIPIARIRVHPTFPARRASARSTARSISMRPRRSCACAVSSSCSGAAKIAGAIARARPGRRRGVRRIRERRSRREILAARVSAHGVSGELSGVRTDRVRSFGSCQHRRHRGHRHRRRRWPIVRRRASSSLGRRRDSVDSFGDWERGLGTESSAVHSDDFVDLAPDAWRADRPPRSSFSPNSTSRMFRFNRVEGLFTGLAPSVDFRSVAPGLSAGAFGGWAWSEKTVRGGAFGRRTRRAIVRRTSRALARIDERLRTPASPTIPGFGALLSFGRQLRLRRPAHGGCCR